MASLSQGASQLADRAGKKNEVVFIKQMKDLVVFRRAVFLGNTLSKQPGLDRHYLQSFKVPMIKVDKDDEWCPIDPEEEECCNILYRSQLPIPEPIRYGVHPFNYVGSVGGSKAYRYTTFGNEPFLQADKQLKDFPAYTFLNNYLYIFNIKTDYIRVEGVLADPRGAAPFQVCEGNQSCYSDEQEFPIDERLMGLIITDITKELGFNAPDEPTIVKVDKSV